VTRPRILVAGGGAWGTAIAAHLASVGHDVRLWMRDARAAEALNRTHRHERYLPGLDLPEGLLAGADLEVAAAGASAAFVAVPSEFCRSVHRAVGRALPAGRAIISTTKGLELDTLQRMSEVAAQEAPGRPLAVLSGPSFAAEVVQRQPTAVVVASAELAVAVQRLVSSPAFRAYSSTDVVGVELAGALKNVIAIAAGIVDGLGYGSNTAAALLTRGLAEITRLAVALGGRADTLAGLAGLGDLVLTCTGGLSRNRRLGQALGAGRTLPEAIAETRQVAEGLRTTQAACVLAERAGIELPIGRAMRAVLYAGQPPREAVDQLMLRTLKRE
jgi:glycerol-3-phosphate dehydrogenase (NAD(P)+)